MSIPVYVTRKTADGFTSAYSMPLWMTLWAMMLIWINVILWSVVGIIEALELLL